MLTDEGRDVGFDGNAVAGVLIAVMGAAVGASGTNHDESEFESPPYSFSAAS